jgi:hypothetical protein
MQAVIAEIISAEDQHDYTGKHGGRPNPAETDRSKIALALLTILRGTAMVERASWNSVSPIRSRAASRS